MSDDFPLVSICVPTYNVQNTIRDTLVSIINQTYSNLIILIVDNASSDDTLKIVSEIKDPRISVYKHSENIGGEGNFNRCLQLASGKYAAIFHADDIYSSDIVKRQVEFLEKNTDAGAVLTQANLINENGVKIGEISIPTSLANHQHKYNFPEVFKAVMQHSNFLVCPSAMLRTEIYQQHIKTWRGDFFHTSSDLDVWFRVLQNYAIGILPERLINYRISKNQYSSKLRARVYKSDFFLVMEHYLAEDSIKNLLSVNDYLNYQRLERTDQILRAVNLYILGDFITASSLSKDLLRFDAVRAAVTNKRGLFTLVAIVTIRLFISINQPRIGQFILSSMKRLVGK